MDVRLQLKIRKNPELFKETIDNEVERLKSLISLSRLDPGSRSSELCSLLVFLPSIASKLEEDISTVIFTYTIQLYHQLEKSLAQSVITAVIMLKKAGQLAPEMFYRQVIPLVEEMSKRTKTIFLEFLICELVRDKEHWAHIKEVLFSSISSGNEAYSKRAVYIFMHLISRNVWRDRESAGKVFEVLEASSPSVALFVLNYLLDKIDLVVKEEEIDLPSEKKRDSKIKKETRGDAKKEEKKRKQLEKKIKKLGEEKETKEPNMVILLQRLGSQSKIYPLRLYKLLKTADYKLETKLKLSQVIARILDHHKASLKGFLGYMTRYLFPHQKHLPLVLTSITQAIHEHTPREEVESVCELISESFCNDYRDDEIIAYGINALTAIIRRHPEAASFKAIEYTTNYRSMNRHLAVTASSALKKMINEVSRQTAPEESDSEDEAPLLGEGASIDEGDRFVTEESIRDIKKRQTKEQIREHARAEKRQRPQKDLPSTNKEKQRHNNFMVRRGKGKPVKKKLSRRSRKKLKK